MDTFGSRRTRPVAGLAALLVVHGMVAICLTSVVQGALEVALGLGLAFGVRVAWGVAMLLGAAELAYALDVGASSLTPDVGAFVQAAVALTTLGVLSLPESRHFFRPSTRHEGEAASSLMAWPPAQPTIPSSRRSS